MTNNVRIRSVEVDGVEFRCEEYTETVYDDEGGSAGVATRRSKWLSKGCDELDAAVAEAALERKRLYDTMMELHARLWPEKGLDR